MSVQIDLSNKTVVVTGAGSGIGLSIAKRFLEANATVVINDILDHAIVKENVGQVEADWYYVNSDISTEVGARNVIKTAVELTGNLDVLVNNAGIVADWHKSYDVNVLGQYFCTDEALKHMVKGSSVIFIGSASSENGGTGYPQYVATKGAGNSLMRFFAREYGKTGIQVNSISPAVIKTAMLRARYESEEAMEKHYSTQVPIGRMGNPEDVANIALFLASELSSYIHGQIIFADGGRYHVG